jgi:hypothetical protein
MLAKVKKPREELDKYFYKKGRENSSIYFNSIPHYQSVRRFLEAVEKLAPEVIDDLYDIAPLYKKMYGLCTNRDTENSDIRFEAEIELDIAICKWAEKYRLIDDNHKQWLYCDIAYRALQVYCNHDKYPWYFISVVKTRKGWERRISEPFIKLSDKIEHPANNNESCTLHKAYPFVFMPSEALTTVYLDGEEEFLQKTESYENPHEIHGEEAAAADSWDPCLESWSDFEKRIDTFYVLYKAAYKKRTVEAFMRNGYVAGKEKQTDELFERFVRYQVQGWSKEKIARECYVTRQAVTNAIKEIAGLVGLEPRPTAKGGRPKKGKV